jgi:hypothetical protein
MESKYQNYYDKLKNQLFSTYTSKYSSTISTVKSKIKSVSTGINTNADVWNEKGLLTLQNSTIPKVLNDLDSVENGLSALSKAVTKCKILVSRLSELDALSRNYDLASEEEKPKYEKKISKLENEIDSIILEINSISMNPNENSKKTGLEINNSYTTYESTYNKFDFSSQKKDFIGDIDDSSQYSKPINYKNVKTVMTGFDNTTGKVVTNNSTITLKPGETRIITVKLPTNTGMIDELKRTSVGGDSTYKNGNVVTCQSNVTNSLENIEYVSYKTYDLHIPENVDLHKNSYDWIITAKENGECTINQICEYTTKDDANWYAKTEMKLKVVVENE